MSEKVDTSTRAKPWMPMFLQAMRNSGNVRASCQAAGISRQAAYAERRKNNKFRTEWDDALQDAVDLLEAAAWQHALNGNPYLIWKVLQSLRRSVYGDKHQVDINITREDRVSAIMERLQCSREEAEQAVAEAERIVAG